MELADVISRLQSARLNDYTFNFYFPPHLNLRLEKNPYRVFTDAPIAAGTFLGIIEGTYGYAWEMSHDLYPFVFIVDDDYMIDTGSAECMSGLSFVREGFYMGMPANVGIVPDQGGLIGLRAIRDIGAGEELVYEAGKFFD